MESKHTLSTKIRIRKIKNVLVKLLQSISEEDLANAIAEAEVNSANEQIRLKDFVSEYLEVIKATKSKAYYKSHVISTKHLLNHYCGALNLSQITKGEAQSFMIELISKVPKGWKVYYRNIKAMFNYAVEQNYLSDNPFKKLSLPKTQKEYPKFIDKEKLEIIKGYISNNTIRDITTTAFYTGLRLAEVVNLKWDNVDFDSHLILVGDSEFSTKSYRSRIIPMTEKIQELFISRYEKELNKVYVFGKDKVAPYTKEYVSRKLKQAAIKSDSDTDIHFHTLRHSFASNLVQNGVEIYTVQKLLGHSSVTTTEIYAHLNTDELKNAINKLNINN